MITEVDQLNCHGSCRKSAGPQLAVHEVEATHNSDCRAGASAPFGHPVRVAAKGYRRLWSKASGGELQQLGPAEKWSRTTQSFLDG